MPLETASFDSRYQTRHTSLREWDIDGHQVAWMRFEGTDVHGQPYAGEDLYCECDFAPASESVDANRCKAKQEVWATLVSEAREANRERWRALDLDARVLDVFERVRAGERLGQRHEKMVYLAELAALLECSQQEVFEACDRLYGQERLDLNGSILIPYEPRFRFPRELQALIALVHEEPFGWPNGEAGDGLLHALESAISDHTQFQHGRDAFHDSWPHLEARHLATFGLRWLHGALAQGLDPEMLAALADDLAEMERRFRRAAEVQEVQAAEGLEAAPGAEPRVPLPS